MARMDLRCACGFHFSVSDAQASKPEGVRCPSCRAQVGIHGPVEGAPQRKTVRVLAATPDLGALKMRLFIGVGVGGLVLGIVVAVLLMGRSAPPPEPAAPSIADRRAAPAVKPKPAARPVAKAGTAPRREAVDPVFPEPSPDPVDPAPSPSSVTTTPPSPLTASTLPDDLAFGLEELLALKEWHLNLAVPATEKPRLVSLRAAGKGMPADIEFLKGVVNGPRGRAVKEEAVFIREGRARLEKEALEGLPVDMVTMKDGRVLHGRVVDETETVVKLERKFAGGVAGELPLNKADVKDVQKGKGLGGEFKTRWETAKKGGPPLLVNLLSWCKENALPLQASLAAHAILVDDPGRAEARQEAGLAADPVSRMIEAEKQGGFIIHEGRRWLPRELKEKLQRDGNFLVDGRWMSPKQRLISVPGLFRYESQNPKPVMISGQLCHDESVTFNTALGQENFDVKAMRRFYAATSMIVTRSKRKVDGTSDADQYVYDDQPHPRAGDNMRGEVTISVPLNAPILEASVMTSAEVKSGGKITVYLIVDGRRIEAYDCESRENKSHKLPEQIRGKTEVQLVVELNGKAGYAKKTEKKRTKTVRRDTDRVIERGVEVTWNQLIPEYPAILFPSNANTVEVFRLTATTGEPAPGLDKLFENAPDILKK